MQEPLNNSEHLLAQGIEAVKAGDRPRARELLAQAIQLSPADERMWLWMSGAVETDNDRRRCLERVLQLNPGNQAAQRGLAAIAPATSAPPAAPATTPPRPAQAADPPPAPAVAAPAADSAPFGAPMPPPIVLSPPHLSDPVMPAEHAPPAHSPPPAPPIDPAPAEHTPSANSSPPAPPILRRLSEQLAPTDAAEPADPALPASPERGSGVQVMADMAKLRSSMQPTSSRRARPLVLVLLAVFAIIVVLAVLFVLGYLDGLLSLSIGGALATR